MKLGDSDFLGPGVSVLRILFLLRGKLANPGLTGHRRPAKAKLGTPEVYVGGLGQGG